MLGFKTSKWLHLAAFGLGYFIAAQVGLLFMVQPEGLAGIWPASGVALAALLLNTRPANLRPHEARPDTPRHLLRWRDILIVIFLINALSNLTTHRLPVSLAFALANTLESALAAWVFTRLVHPAGLRLPVTFERLSDMLRLIVVAVFANGLTALVGSLVPSLAYGASYLDVWRVWWIEDGLGMLIITPLWITWAPSVLKLGNFNQLIRRRGWWIESSIVLVSLTTASWILFAYKNAGSRFEPHPYMLFALLLWVGLRYHPRGVSAAMGLVSVIALYSTATGLGSFPLGGQTPADRLIYVQIFLSVASLTEMSLAAVFTERKKAEAELRARETELRTSEAELRAREAMLLNSQATLLESTADLKKSQRIARVGSWTWDTETNALAWSDEMYTIYGVDKHDSTLDLPQVIAQVIHPEDRARVEAVGNRVLEQQQPATIEYRVVWPNGEIRTVLATSAEKVLDANGKIRKLSGVVQDITERKAQEDALHASEAQFRRLVETAPDPILINTSGRIVYANNSLVRLMGAESPGALLGKPVYDFFHPQYHDLIRARAHALMVLNEPVPNVEEALVRLDGSTVMVEVSAASLVYQGQPSILVFLRDITARKRAEAELRESELELRKANDLLARAQRIARLGSWEHDLATNQMTWSDEMYEIHGLPLGAPIYLHELIQHFPPEDQARLLRVVERAAVEDNHAEDFAFIRPDGQLIYVHEEGQALRDEHGQVVKVYGVTHDITEQKMAEIEVRTQLQRLQALSRVDQAVLTSLDLDHTLDVLLDEVLEQLHIDAAAVLLFDPQSQTLRYQRGRGFHTPQIENTCLALGQGLAGQIAQTGEPVVACPLFNGIGTTSSSLFAAEGFSAYIGLPLTARSKITGVLEVFHRSPLDPTLAWLDYLRILSGQAAIAVDNLLMLGDLQRANTNLEIAYDTTIAGWSNALDLRDRETEGHSQRVTQLTVALARQMGLPEAQIVQISRGALLHDIGKMGVPDQILLKPGSLTPDEWVKMRQHPQFALDLLSPIAYLHGALDIPYCHHERWDGSGYPRGLAGESIPLPARIFAIADVYDALTADRPYRPAWEKSKAVEYIREQSGKHFDPRVVEAFIIWLEETGAR